MRKHAICWLGFWLCTFMHQSKIEGSSSLDRWKGSLPATTKALLQDLRLVAERSIPEKNLRVLTYKQWINQIPVENSQIKIVLKAGTPEKTLLVTSRIATQREIREPLQNPNRQQIEEVIAMQAKLEGIKTWKELKIFYWIDPINGRLKLLYERTGLNGSLSHPIAKSIRVDAETAELYEVKNLILHIERTGFASGAILEGLYPFQESNPARWQVLADLLVHRTDSLSNVWNFTDTNGAYNLSWSDEEFSGRLQAQLEMPWGRIRDHARPTLVSTTAVEGSGRHDFQLGNDLTDEFSVAQTNTQHQLGQLHSWLRDLGKADLVPFLEINTNLNDECNAYYYDRSINFFRSSGFCVNTAYSTVIVHETGHAIVENLGLDQEAFGEGFSDALAMLFYDTPSVGHNFYYWSGTMRDPGLDRISFPCLNNFHFCGQVLAGIWWDIKTRLEELDVESGRRLTHSLFFNWAELTSGAAWPNSTSPVTPSEVLIADDDDWNLENGTPHWNQICSAFENHGMACPPLSLYQIQPAAPLPQVLSPTKTTPIRIRIIEAESSQPIEQVRLEYFQNNNPPESLIMNPEQNGHYAAQLPAFPCGSTVNYRFVAESNLRLRQHLPADSNWYESVVAEGLRSLGNFRIPDADASRWTVVNQGLESGAWIISPINPQWIPWRDADQNMFAWMTGANEVDHIGGYTELRSPTFATSDLDFIVLRYSRWMGATWLQSHGRFTTSACAGLNCQTLEDVTGFFPHWTKRQFVVPGGATGLEFRFRHSEAYPRVESKAGLDEIEIVGARCSQSGQMSTEGIEVRCVADFNQDGDVNEADLRAYEEAFQAQRESADLNRDGRIDSSDYVLFLNHYSEGC